MRTICEGMNRALSVEENSGSGRESDHEPESLFCSA